MTDDDSRREEGRRPGEDDEASDLHPATDDEPEAGDRAAERPPRLFKTGDVVTRSGVSRQMVYQYTAMGLLKPAETSATGHRLYDERVFTHLRLIQDLLKSGYTLRDIKDIFFKERGN